ncbi:CusA/CzcA family heavy metal efflux RND transporter, partial [bacterium]|nr:CusA/CzcA family heavy metal efflux RND transporter [bacterium]
MFDKIITYSVKNKFVIGLLVLALIIWGLFSLKQLPIDAVPDITNNQVQIITSSPTLATQEVEKFITTPVELSLQNIQQTVEIRSISRFGLSVVTVVFEEEMDLYLARQLVSENLKAAEDRIPSNLGVPEMSPISTGLGEIYQYVVLADSGYEDKYSLTELRSIQDWIVKRQLSGIDGVVEVNTLGGYLKQYEVSIEPDLLKSVNLSITDVYVAIQNSNENTGGAYIEKNPNTYYIRTNGIAKSLEDIGNIVVSVRNGNPILVKDVAKVQFGKAPRFGALTTRQREAVGGTVMMLKGENSAEVIERVKLRMTQIEKSLPKGVIIRPYLDRDKLISTAIGTVTTNLIEGGLIVIFILILFLGNWRAGLIVASVIPLAMLFAVAMMNQLGISANLMSLGAIDFGLIVDGAVIIVEAILHRLYLKNAGRTLTENEMDGEVLTASKKIRSSAAFGEIIILMVYIPILALVGIEGKMFKPMAQTVMLAIAGALILSLTYVPMMSALFLNKTIKTKKTFADRMIAFFHKLYEPLLAKAFQFKRLFVGLTIAVLALSMFVFSRMGGEFIPVLEEGDLALHQILPPGSSLSQSVEVSKIIQKKLMDNFPEIEDVVTKIGSAEIPTDPMPIETGDIMVIMKPKSEWTSASSKQELFEKMEKVLRAIPGMEYEFSQPIQMRFNELMTGSRADIAIKLYGDDLDILFSKAKEAEEIINSIEGVGSVKVEQITGMPQITIDYKYEKLAQYGLHVKDVNRIVKTAFAGEKAGVIYEGDQNYDLVVRMNEELKTDISSVEDLYITLDNGIQIPLSEVSEVKFENAPMQISRDNTKRRIVVGVNVGDTDVESLVESIQDKLDANIQLPAGYYFNYGGQFENLKAANARLSVALPIALALIFILLYFTFGSISQALLIFTAIPLSAIGGIWALELRGLPFSISAGIGFIALFGVAVLNGIVLIGYFNELKKEGMSDIIQRIKTGTKVRLRPVLMTAAVASLGFLPMAISTSGGAEVQRPLATVVIGGLITATFLTLIILPIFYYWVERWNEKRNKVTVTIQNGALTLLLLVGMGFAGQAQIRITVDSAIQIALENNATIKMANLEYEKNKKLQNVRYSPGATEVFYQGDGLIKGNNQQVNQIGVVQNFPSPGATRAQNRLQYQVSKQSDLKTQLTKNEITWKVRKLYYSLLCKKEIIAIYRDQIGPITNFYHLAEARVKAGEANMIEMLSMESKFREMQVELKQLVVDVTVLEYEFNTLLNAKSNYTTNFIIEINDAPLLDSIDPLFLQAQTQQIEIEKAKVKMIQAELKPNFKAGYSAQNYYQGGPLTGVQAGISLPIFRGKTKRKIAAQNIEVEIAQQNYKTQEIEYNQQVLAETQRIYKYKFGIEYTKSMKETINPEIIRLAKLNYEKGEISYLELLNSYEIAMKNYLNYWTQVNGFFNSTVNY